MFSTRLPEDLTPNHLSAAISARRASGRPFIDLTLTNPTTADIPYPADILAPLARAEAALYRPEPFGLRAAREAVARDYERRRLALSERSESRLALSEQSESRLALSERSESKGTSVADAGRIVLTASTSEAYSLLFKLLCDPGDEVLVPVPSYPLFDHLSSLDAVRTRPYRLEYHGKWTVDGHSVDAGWTPHVRGVLAVSPNNPTGSVLSNADFHMLASRCAEHDAALIIDEVFADYVFADEVFPSDTESHALTFRLGGLSKSAGLPQVKLGWILVDGPDVLVNEALERLEIICDTYLSVSTPVQVAAEQLIERGAAVRGAILDRVRANFSALSSVMAQYPALALLHADGGWSAVLRVPSTRSEEEIVLDLLEDDDVLVHPGYFFDFPTEAFLVVSLLPPPDVFREGIRRLTSRLDG